MIRERDTVPIGTRIRIKVKELKADGTVTGYSRQRESVIGYNVRMDDGTVTTVPIEACDEYEFVQN